MQRGTSMEQRLVSRLKLRQLRLLVAVGEQGNIFRAANELNIAQPAATKSIHDLELTFGAKLFERSNRGVRPTLQGDVIIRHAKLVLAQMRQAADELTSLSSGIYGRIMVGALLAGTPTLLPQSILKARRERPGIAISVMEGTNDKLLPMLRTGELDLVLGRLPEDRELTGLQHEFLYDEPIVVVVRNDHPLCSQADIVLSDLLGYEWILPSGGTSLRLQLEDAFRAADLPTPVRSVESVSILANYALLRESEMIAVFPERVASMNPQLAALPIHLETAPSPVGYTTRQGSDLSGAASFYLSVLRSVAESHRTERDLRV